MDKTIILKVYSVFVLLLNIWSGIAQEIKYSSQDISINAFVDGTLLTPNSKERPILAILIADYGPTDRNGNQNFLKNNSLKKLAENLSNHDIATFRYDKRTVKQLRAGKAGKNIMFDDFIKDAIEVIEYFKMTNAFSKIYVIGHGQGSLIGMLASKDRTDGFISLSGAGQSIDKVLIEQVQKTAPMFTEDTKRVFDLMREGKITSNYPQELSSFLDSDIQPFMKNWMDYDPQEVIKSLDMPILIVNGTKDLQVGVEEAKLLKEASTNAELKIIDKMNHVLFIIEGDDLENAKSYNESFRALPQELITTVLEFIK